MTETERIDKIDYRNLVEDLSNLGVRKGDLLNLKVSLKSIGWIQGGAKTLIDAILDVIGKEGTIVSDAFVQSYPLPLSKKHSTIISNERSPSYAGMLANAMIEYPGMFRSSHPIQKFVAIGRLADDLMSNHTPDSSAYDVLYNLTKMGGKNLKIGDDKVVVGVGTTHVAVALLGFKKKRRISPRGVNFIDEKGETRVFEVNWSGGCGRGFNNFLEIYKERGAIISEGFVGNAKSKITDMQKTLEIEMEVLKTNPRFFLCSDPLCFDCRASWEFSGNSISSVLLKSARPLISLVDKNDYLKKKLKLIRSALNQIIKHKRKC